MISKNSSITFLNARMRFGELPQHEAYNIGARLQERHQAFDHLLRRLVVDDFHVDQLGLSGIRLNHDRGVTYFFYSAPPGEVSTFHLHAGATVQGDYVGAMLLP